MKFLGNKTGTNSKSITLNEIEKKLVRERMSSMRIKGGRQRGLNVLADAKKRLKS